MRGRQDAHSIVIGTLRHATDKDTKHARMRECAHVAGPKEQIRKVRAFGNWNNTADGMYLQDTHEKNNSHSECMRKSYTAHAPEKQQTCDGRVANTYHQAAGILPGYSTGTRKKNRLMPGHHNKAPKRGSILAPTPRQCTVCGWVQLNKRVRVLMHTATARCHG